MARRRLAVLNVSDRDFTHSGTWSDDETLKSETSTRSTTSESVRLEGHCRVCGVAFKITKRRYQCGACGQSVCRTHAHRKALLPGTRLPVRICDQCIRKPLEALVRQEAGDPQGLYQRHFQRLQEEGQSLEQSIVARESEIAELRVKAEKLAREQEEGLKEIKEKVEEEMRLRVNKEGVVKHLREIAVSSQGAETAQNERLQISEKMRGEAQDTVLRLRSEISEAEALAAHYTLQLQSRIHLAETRRLFCDVCREAVCSSLSPRGRVPSFETSMARKKAGRR